MHKFINKPEWQVTVYIFSIVAIVRTICAYINPEAFLTYMHIALTEGLVIAIVIGHLSVKLNPLLKNNRVVLYYACIAAALLVTNLACEFVAQTATLGRFNFKFVLLATLAAIVLMMAVTAAILHIVQKNKLNTMNKKLEEYKRNTEGKF